MKHTKKPYDTSLQHELTRRHQDYVRVYNTPEGKSVIDDILFYTSIDRTAFCLQNGDQTNFNLGKQSIGYHILNILNNNHEQVKRKYNESNK